MEVKLFEIRDVHTFIPVMAIKLCGRSEQERYLLYRAGFGRTWRTQSEYILMSTFGTNAHTTVDPFTWKSHTLEEAHVEILHKWSHLNSGDVIDLEYLRGESLEPKKSEYIDDNPPTRSTGNAH